LRGLAIGQIRRAARQLGRPDEARHDGVHQARKAIRRARAALALGGHAFNGEPRVRRLDAGLRQLCRGLSALRDADALNDALLHLADEAVIGPLEGDRLRAPVLRRRAKRLADALRRDPDLARRRERLLIAAEAMLALPWTRVTRADLEAAHAESLRRLHRAAKQARGSTDPEDWHTLRRRVRRLRQQESLLADLLPEGWSPTPGLAELAERMGLAQDHALLLAQCRRAGMFAAADRALLRRWVEPLYAAAQIQAAEAVAALRRAQRAST
jgi:CHAD domain-containing protein